MPDRIAVSILNLITVIAVGLGLGFLSVQNNHLLHQQVDQATRDACNSAGIKKFPEFLTDPPELQKLIDFDERCAVANGLKPAPSIKLP